MIKILIDRHLNGFNAATILEIGPGFGDFGCYTASVVGAKSITFIDCDDEVLRHQIAQCKLAGLQGNAINADLEHEVISLPERYDLILLQEVLEHVIDAEGLLKRLVQSLSANGRIVITVPTRLSERWLRAINPGYMRNEPHGHVRQFSRQALINLLEEAGLISLVIQPTQPHYFVAHTWLYATRTPVDGATGRITSTGLRVRIFSWLLRLSYFAFRGTGIGVWSSILPRNFFLVATKKRS